MITYNARSCNSIYVVPCLQVTDLQRMVDMGFLSEDDEIRKDGHRTWHAACEVVGLNFGKPERIKIRSKQVDEWTFQLLRPSGETEGPFKFETLADLAKNNSITLNCCLLPPACMKPIKIENFRSITVDTPLQRLFVKWDKDKTDGPMHSYLVQELVSSGMVPTDCFVRGEDETHWTEFAKYRFPNE